MPECHKGLGQDVSSADEIGIALVIAGDRSKQLSLAVAPIVLTASLPIGINYRSDPEWDQKVKKASGGRGADIIVETGGATLPRPLNAVAFGGFVAVVGFVAGYEAAIELRSWTDDPGAGNRRRLARLLRGYEPRDHGEWREAGHRSHLPAHGSRRRVPASAGRSSLRKDWSDALTDLQSIVCRRGPAEPASRGKESHCREPQESRCPICSFTQT
jgi:hypothetical protein